jgi:hypothetical protein
VNKMLGAIVDQRLACLLPFVSAVLLPDTHAAESTSCSTALSRHEKLHVPLGYCSSGLSADEYTLIPVSGLLLWCWNGCTTSKYAPSLSEMRS